jgi:Ca2+-binding RTX toxin-like protein
VVAVSLKKINNPIRNRVGTTKLTAGQEIKKINQEAVIGGSSIFMNAATGIGSDNTLRTNVTSSEGVLSAITSSGDIRVHEILGGLKIGQVTTSITSGDVVLTAQEDIMAAGPSSLVRGGAVTLTAEYGPIGSLGTDGTAANPDTDAHALMVDTGSTSRDGLLAQASGDVYLREQIGDLRLVSVVAPGDVRIEVASGNLVDGNTVEVRDTRTEAQLDALWDRMWATEDTANESITRTIEAYENVKTRDYQAYWRYRNQQPDPAVYDPNFQVTLSEAERAYYEEYYAGQGLNPAEIEDAITTLENQRTTEYHTLHKTYGNLGNSYDPDWSYDVDDPNLHQRFDAVGVDSSIDVGMHVFTNGQAVMYHSDGGSIDGLEDGEIYYVVLDDAEPGKLRLAATQEDATAATPNVISLVYVSGDGHYLSDGDVLKQRAAWSESQLQNSVSASILRPKTVSGTTTTIEDPNIVGRNIALNVFGHIGVTEEQIDISLPLSDSLSPEQRYALAAAEGDDVIFYADVGGTLVEIEPDDLDQTAALVRIEPKEDVDVEAEGVVTAEAGEDVNLGSEETVNIDQVLAGDPATRDGEVRLKVQQALINDRTDAQDPVNIRSGDLILEAEEQSIGSETAPLLIDLATGGSLIARANHNIYIHGHDCDLNIKEVFANDFVDLRADGSILDALNDDSTIAAWDINTHTVYLEAGDSIGADTGYLEIDLDASGKLNAVADQDIYLHQIVADMHVDMVRSSFGDVGLKAAGSILELDDTIESNPSVIGNSIILVAEYGAIGAPLGDHMDINSAYSGAGTLTSSSEFNTYIREPVGDLWLGTVETKAGTAFITVPDGRILNGNNGGTNVLSGMTYLFASEDIGEEGNPITTEVGNIEGQSTTGSTWIMNSGALTVGGVVDSPDPCLFGGGSVNITASSPLMVTEDIIFDSDITLKAADSAESGDDLTVVSDVKVITSDGTITLEGGDRITLQEGSIVQATEEVYLRGDSGNSDPEGALIEPFGTISGSSVELFGDSDDDVFDLRKLAVPASVSGGRGSDTLIGPDGDNIWEIDDPNSGNLNEFFTFESVENLTSGDGNDTFYFLGDGYVDGIVDGGDGFDTLDFLLSDFIQEAASDYLLVDLPVGDEPVDFAATGGIVRIEDILVILLAEVQEDGTLVLNMGPRAAERLAINTEDGDEVFTLSHVAGDPAAPEGETIRVTAFGISLDYTGVRAIRGWGGQGDDAIILSSDILSPAELDGGVGNDHLVGGAGADVLYGGEGNDTLEGGPGSDLMDGGTGDDQYIIVPGSVDEVIDVQGWDSLDFSKALLGVTVDLDKTRGQIQELDAAGNKLVIRGVIENATGSEFDDRIYGNRFDNILDGRGGDDRLYGECGDDLLAGGAGDDYIGTDTLRSSIDGAIGTDYDDILIGDSSRSEFHGMGGDDFIDGRGGNDLLYGGEGDDTIRGDRGNDYIEGGAGDDDIAAGRDNDTVIWNEGDGNDSIDMDYGWDTLRVYTYDSNDTVTLTSPAKNEVEISGTGSASWNLSVTRGDIFEINTAGGDDVVEIYDLERTDVNEVVLHLGAGDDRVEGAEATETIKAYGEAGNDLFVGGSDDDTFDGGEGTDWVDYSTAPKRVKVDLRYKAHQDGRGSRDYLKDVENVIGTPFSDDIWGTDGDNEIWTLGGNDDVWARGGDDLVYGGEGRDELRGDDGNDVLYGGEGDDDLRGGRGDDVLYGENGDDYLRGDDGDDILRGGDGEDRLYGDRGDDRLYGGSGDDKLSGGSGNDMLFGRSGDDRLYGGSGDDVLKGGKGKDYLSGDSGSDLLFGGLDDDKLDGGSGNDVLKGRGGNDLLIGSSGDDQLYGGSGDDTLIGGSGDDVLEGGSGEDILIDWSYHHKHSKWSKKSDFHHKKTSPCASWVHQFVNDLATEDETPNPNGDIKIELPTKHEKRSKSR